MPTTRKSPPNAVLYVDDEVRSLRNFSRLLSDRFEVLTASSVDEAIGILDDPDRAVAVLISDQRMPGRTGVDLLNYAREHHPQTVRILTTAYSDLDSAVEAVNQGEVWRYINKPWHPDALCNEIRQAFALFELRSERDQLIAEKQRTMRLMTANARLQALVAGLCGRRDAPWAFAALKKYLTQTAALNTRSIVEDAAGVIRLTTETRFVCGVLAEFQRMTERSHAETPPLGSSISVDEIEGILRTISDDRGVALERSDNTDGREWRAAVNDGERLRQLLDCIVALAAASGPDGVSLQWAAGPDRLDFFITPATPEVDVFITQPVDEAVENAAERVGRCVALYVLAEMLLIGLEAKPDGGRWSLSFSWSAQGVRPDQGRADAPIDYAEEIESIFEWFNSFLNR